MAVVVIINLKADCASERVWGTSAYASPDSRFCCVVAVRLHDSISEEAHHYLIFDL